ncbi:restriction endonuclease subunit S [Clostridium sp. MB05]|uniref:restriction endonuclease subunit S n=1 Tax=Clostridium sp. MB05 TaxID=3376682 RepID=UPI00398265C5
MKRVKFDECFDKMFDFRGKTPKKIDMDWGGGDIPALSANNVKMGKIDFSQPTYYGSEKLYNKWMNKGNLKKGDVLMTMEAPLGNTVLIPDNKKYILSQRVVAFRTTKDVYNKYFMYYIMSPMFRKELDKYSTGTTATGISQKNLFEIYINIPEYKQQQKIAKVLATLDQNIEKTTFTIEKYKKVKKGLMDDLLTGKIRIKDGKWIKETEFKWIEGIGEVPKEWDNGNITTLVEVNPKKNIKKLLKEDIVSFIAMEDTSEEAKVTNMTDKKLYEVEKGYTNFHENDILFAKITPCLENGKGGLAVGLTNGVGFGSTEFHVLRSKNKKSIMFVYQYSKYNKLRIKAAGLMVGSAGQQRIGKDFFESYKIGIPNYDEQKSIGEILYKQDQLIEKEEQYLQKLQKLKSGLMEDLLTGKKRVKI